MTDKEHIKNLRQPTEDNPLRVLFSACLLGTLCGVDGSSNGYYPHIVRLSKLSTVSITSFCPEHFALGTPRETPDIADGSGADVIDGNAKVITESGRIITKEMIIGAEKMVEVAKENDVEIAIMMDVSAACGSQVTYKGHRFSDQSEYQIGMGVSAELLKRNGIKIISQRDYKSLELLLSKLDPRHEIDEEAIDQDETEWYLDYFHN